MCLEIVATVPVASKGRVSAKRLSEVSGLAVTPRKIDGLPSLHFAVTGGCSCEFLSDDADPEAETWALESSHLPALAQSLSTLGKECGEFSFIARWLTGERPRLKHSVSAASLVMLARTNTIGNNVLYHVV